MSRFRFALCLALLCSMTVALADGIVTRALAPLTFSVRPSNEPDWPGDANIIFEPTTGELELRVMRHGDIYSLEAQIALRGVKQSILETDATGKLTKEAVFSGTPFIRFFLPGVKDPKIINLKCDPQKCTGVWRRFAYTPGAPQTITCTVNVRGLQGKKWDVTLNQVIPERDKVKLVPDTRELKVTDQKAKNFRQTILRTRLYTKGEYLPPGQTKAVEPDAIDEWDLILNTDQTAGLGYIRNTKLTLYEVHRGPILLEVSEGATLESLVVNEGERVWIRPGMVHALRPQTEGGKTARVRRLEFTL